MKSLWKNNDNAGVGAKTPPKKQALISEAHVCQSFLAHFKIPKEVGSKTEHASHTSQTSYYFLFN